MNLRKAVLVLAAVVVPAAVAPSVHAQLAVYGTVTVNQLSGIKSSPEPNPNNLGSKNDSVSPLGGTGGIYYDFLKLGPVKLGADLRGTLTSTKRGAYTNYNGAGARLYSGLGGVRAVFHTRFVPIRPYLQASAGIARTNYGILYNGAGVTTTDNPLVGNNIVLRNNFQYMGYAGVDITLLPYMDFRLVEFGYGGLNPMGTYGHNYPIKSVSSGLVFHLPF
jgi:hypothetical protein